MRINREPAQKVTEAVKRLLDGEYHLQTPGEEIFYAKEDQETLASAYLDYVIDRDELSRPAGLTALLTDACAAIDANNGRCGLIEDVLCRVTSLVVSLQTKDYEITGPFRIGRFLDIRRDDKSFPTIREARSAAYELAKTDRREVIAVWHGDKLDRLFVCGQECEPVPF